MISVVGKLSISLLLASSVMLGAGLDLKKKGVSIEFLDANDEKASIVIKRIHDEGCKKVNGMDPNVIWGGDYALKSVPNACKKTFVTTVGKISPIKIADGIDTYGELEVIDFMKKAQKDENMILVDARTSAWFEKRTIPTSINLPFKGFNPKSEDFELILDTAGVEVDEGTYDFTNAKTMVLFCNGIWCPQSSWAIQNLLKIGYPKDKLKWYRGGMYDWTSVNLTTVIPE